MSEENTLEVTPDFVLTVAQTLESRIDYNFNSIMQISLLVEFLYQTLEEQGIEIPLDEKFEAFQKERVEEIQKKFQEVAASMTQEVVDNANKSTTPNADINLEDD